ncbi:MAG: 16S rRNA (adenine(1518)-N(6)/adenine(1519)-N(6))-dimethyltransferase, partial [Bacilli bacterium]|nr:16S rRNA (adenine(1518)-N(6)/adenine(1519)-N(6))-dimethyltransferase [Bacilli bacterium]
MVNFIYEEILMEFNFKKKYGQNFLTNRGIIDSIVNSIDPSENDLIIEIGPGGG